MKAEQCFSIDVLHIIGKPVLYYPGIAIAIKDVQSAIFLSQFLYWEGKQADPDGWIYKSQDEIYNETGLNAKIQLKCREFLKNNGILSELRKTTNIYNSQRKEMEYKNVVHYKFHWDILEEILNGNSELKSRYENHINHFKKDNQISKLENCSDDNQISKLENYSNIDQNSKLENWLPHNQNSKLENWLPDQISNLENSTIYTENTNTENTHLPALENFSEANKEKIEAKKNKKNFSLVAEKKEKSPQPPKEKKEVGEVKAVAQKPAENSTLKNLQPALNKRDLQKNVLVELVALMFVTFNQRETTAKKERLESDLSALAKKLALTAEEMLTQFNAYIEFKRLTKGILHSTPQNFISDEGFDTLWTEKVKTLDIGKPISTQSNGKNTNQIDVSNYKNISPAHLV